MMQTKYHLLQTVTNCNLPELPQELPPLIKRTAALGFDDGKSVILVREETKPEDVPAFFASAGILTSHAAWWRVESCIVGASEMKIDVQAKMHLSDKVFQMEIITRW